MVSETKVKNEIKKKTRPCSGFFSRCCLNALNVMMLMMENILLKMNFLFSVYKDRMSNNRLICY